MKFSSLIVFLLLVSGLGAEQRPMNVLMIAVDDLNDWVGFLDGHPQAKTPYMDRLASEGVVFENAQCAAPVCNASRVALMSGIAPYLSGIVGNKEEMRESSVLKDALMLPQYFSKYGYTSMARGKIYHNAGDDPQSWDIMSDHRKDRIRVRRADRTDMTPYADVKIDNSLVFVQNPQIAWKSTLQSKEQSRDFQNATWTAQWLTDSAEQETPLPFFLACGIFRPHLPWTVPAEYYTRFDLEQTVVPDIGGESLNNRPNATTEYDDAIKRGLRKEVAWAYLANIAYADDCVGEVLNALEQSPYRDNTIVVLWSDHGWHVGEKFRYKKNTPWEESARMPFIIKVPGMESGRSVRPVSLIDLYPTLIELAGLPPKADLSGRSIKPLLEDPDRQWDHPALTTVEGRSFSVRDERWRYILDRKGEELLFDHENDPHEWVNLANRTEHASVLKRLRAVVPAEHRR